MPPRWFGDDGLDSAVRQTFVNVGFLFFLFEGENKLSRCNLNDELHSECQHLRG